MEFIFQILSTLVVAFIENFIDKSVKKTFDKEKYCREYISSKQEVNQNNYLQTGNISKSSVCVNQNNISNINNHYTNIRQTTTTSNDNGDGFVILILIFLGLGMFMFFFGYLKFKLNFDLWNPILLLVLASISLFLYWHNFKANQELYWERKEHFASIILLFAMLIFFSYTSLNTPEFVQFASQLQETVLNSTSFINGLEMTFNLLKQDLNSIFPFLYFSISSLLPIIILSLDIFNQLKSKKPFLNQNYILFVSVVFLVLPNFMSFISSI